jgi:hypothetical protein
MRTKARCAARWLASTIGLLCAAGSAACGATDAWQDEPVAEVEQDLDVTRFRGWEALAHPGVFLGGAAVLNVDGDLNHIEVYGQGTDGDIWYARRTQPSAGWEGWFDLGGPFVSKPSVTLFGANRTAVVALGDDDRTYIGTNDGPGTPFTPWKIIDTVTAIDPSGAPAIAYIAPYLFVVQRRTDRKLYWTRNDVSAGLNHARWSAWKKIEIGVVSSEPSITVANNRFVLAVRGSDDRIWINGTGDHGDTWGEWRSIGTRTFRDSPAISWHGGSLEVAGRSLDDKVWIATANAATGATTGWNTPGAVFLTAPPGAAANPSASTGRYAVVARRSDGKYFLNVWQ